MMTFIARNQFDFICATAGGLAGGYFAGKYGTPTIVKIKDKVVTGIFNKLPPNVKYVINPKLLEANLSYDDMLNAQKAKPREYVKGKTINIEDMAVDDIDYSANSKFNYGDDIINDQSSSKIGYKELDAKESTFTPNKIKGSGWNTDTEWKTKPATDNKIKTAIWEAKNPESVALLDSFDDALNDLIKKYEDAGMTPQNARTSARAELNLKFESSVAYERNVKLNKEAINSKIDAKWDSGLSGEVPPKPDALRGKLVVYDKKTKTWGVWNKETKVYDVYTGSLVSTQTPKVELKTTDIPDRPRDTAGFLTQYNKNTKTYEVYDPTTKTWLAHKDWVALHTPVSGDNTTLAMALVNPEVSLVPLFDNISDADNFLGLTTSVSKLKTNTFHPNVGLLVGGYVGATVPLLQLKLKELGLNESQTQLALTVLLSEQSVTSLSVVLPKLDIKTLKVVAPTLDPLALSLSLKKLDEVKATELLTQQNFALLNWILPRLKEKNIVDIIVRSNVKLGSILLSGIRPDVMTKVLQKLKIGQISTIIQQLTIQQIVSVIEIQELTQDQVQKVIQDLDLKQLQEVLARLEPALRIKIIGNLPKKKKEELKKLMRSLKLARRYRIEFFFPKYREDKVLQSDNFVSALNSGWYMRGSDEIPKKVTVTITNPELIFFKKEK